MTPIEQFVWDRLGVAKYCLGRKRVQSMVWIASDLHAKNVPAENIAAQMCKAHGYGMGVLSMLILSAVVNQVIKLVIEWLRQREAP